MIVERPVALPRDPLSEYIAKEPEEMFSPYQESGQEGLHGPATHRHPQDN